MAAADGFIVRVKPRLSRIDAPTARAIAAAVSHFTDGSIVLTSRANLQMRGLTEDSVTPFALAMMDCGVADADPAAERRRNIIVAPLCDHAHRVALDLERALADAHDFVPSEKFGFAVDSDVAPLGETVADVTVRLEAAGCVVSIAGARRGVNCDPSTAAGTAMELARAFLVLGGARRMGDLVAARGEAAIYAAASFAAERELPAPEATPTFEGLIAYPGGGAIGLAAPAGRLDAARLRQLAALAERFGDGQIRMTPRRGVVIAAADRDLPALARAA